MISRPIRPGGSSGGVGAAHHCRLHSLPHCWASMIHAPLGNVPTRDLTGTYITGAVFEVIGIWATAEALIFNFDGSASTPQGWAKLRVASQERCKSGLTWAPLTCVHILCDGGGIRWCQGGFCSACRVWLRQLGRWVVQRSAQVGQQPQSGRGHGEPAPSGRGAIEHCPHQRQAGVLAWQPADDLHPPARFPEGAFD